ncbi:hypothetical protein L227DRAFT_577969 [Lentinus tigrinus ALCF2SS1-6]|uniref:F-box domain-containing protein n=2 Tax=Lentinus tigrinus TaxID=5365 RepID=A0A5C2S1Q3_9APHY|nr:hypothetical protein L227DRAFT_577969 [Lentinus tigrinus ALCF2SS1-6]
MVASSSLRKLEVFLDTEMDAGDFKAFLGKVRRMVPSELSSLELFPNEFTPTSPKLSLADILKPMLSLRHIHELTCQFRTYPKDPSADDIAAFVAAWPELRFLWIIYDQDVPRDRQPIPFSTVVNLSQRCPNLEQLVLTSVDVSQAQIPSPLSSIPRMKQSRVRLVQLRDVIGESKADLLALALATDRLFPNLSIPSHIRCRPYRGEKDLWQRVIDSVACIQAARRICD